MPSRERLREGIVALLRFGQLTALKHRSDRGRLTNAGIERRVTSGFVPRAVPIAARAAGLLQSGTSCDDFMTDTGEGSSQPVHPVGRRFEETLDAADDLLEAAHAVIDANWAGTYTRPAPELSPHQWSWDTAFIAVGRAWREPARARQELQTLFDATVPAGAYSRGPRSGRSSARPPLTSVARHRASPSRRSTPEPLWRSIATPAQTSATPAT